MLTKVFLTFPDVLLALYFFTFYDSSQQGINLQKVPFSVSEFSFWFQASDEDLGGVERDIMRPIIYNHINRLCARSHPSTQWTPMLEQQRLKPTDDPSRLL